MKKRKYAVPLSLFILFSMSLIKADCKRIRKTGEFLAGTFILTQKSLSEAPYRYAGVLRKALDKAEAKDPPSKADEENCDVRYRILPSGRRSVLDILPNTLSLTLKDDNEIVIGAKIYTEVTAKTWIWKGINFGLLGCLKINSCSGQIVTYSANIDTKVSFKAIWDSSSDKLSIKIKPVETRLNDVNVAGCKPPWYLSWFDKWKELLNEGVTEAFQEFADNYEHQTEIPEEFTPFKNVFVHYYITNLIWTKEHVVFEAWATFSVLVNGKNETFNPHHPNSEGLIPLQGWNTTSPDDVDSHLLQGIRLSTEFINGLMWFASVTNITEYHGSVNVLDSQVNGTISYKPPVFKVESDEVLTVSIPHGLILATCKPKDENETSTKVLFKAEFSNLAGSGRIGLASTDDKTGIKVNIDRLDMSHMTTKPFEPKLPLPEQFEGEILRNAIAQLQPVVNRYLKEKPMTLPESLAPFAASPQLHLRSTGQGAGYAELLSYCTCDSDSGSLFAKCDDRSLICSSKTNRIARGRKGTDSMKKTIIVNSGNAHTAINGISNNIESTSVNVAIDAGYEASNLTYDDFQRLKQNISYIGYYVTIFEDTSNCRLENTGTRASVYWIWQTNFCTPINPHGERATIYYILLNNGTLKFECSDQHCRHCKYYVAHLEKSDKCLDLRPSTSNAQSIRIGKPYIHSWESSYGNTSVIANVFFTNMFCLYHPRYIEPQILSTHISIGLGDTNRCIKTSTGAYIRNRIDLNTTNNSMVIGRAHWECDDYCYGCKFRLSNIGLSNCHDYRNYMKVMFTQTIEEIKTEDITTLESKTTVYISVGCATCIAVILLVGMVLAFYKNKVRITEKTFKITKPTLSDLKDSLMIYRNKFLNFTLENGGIRFIAWKTQEEGWGKRLQDLIQNLMLLVNGVMAVVFAEKWNGNDNPLMIINNKFRTSFSFSGNTSDINQILQTKHVNEFVDLLNFWIYAVNIFNGVSAMLIIVSWLLTKTGDRGTWIKIRLLNACSMLGSIFIVLAAIIFTTYFEDLVVLNSDKGYFITDNESMRKFVASAIKISLNGVSLTVISFTIVFLFHGVGGGLFCGTVLFRLVHIHSKRKNMEALTTLLVILTIIQPFICLHPVIIWSQDSNQNSTFLLLIIFIWFLPICVHVVVKAVISPGVQRCKSVVVERESSIVSPNVSQALNESVDVKKNKGIQYKTSNAIDTPNEKEKAKDTNNPEKCRKRSEKWLKILDLLVQITQLLFFIITFSIATNHIVRIEFSIREGRKERRENLQDFVLPAIISVFVWMASISFLLLSLVFEETRKESPKLVFRDQNLDTARNLLRQSLRRRLQSMDRADGRRSIKARSLQRQCMLEAVSNREAPGRERNAKSVNPSSLTKPTRPAPPPPTRNTLKHDTISSFTNIQIVTASASRNIDLNHSLNGQNVNFESKSLIRIKNSDQQMKPKIPAKPKHLQNVQNENKSGTKQCTLLHSSKRSISSKEEDKSTVIPMQTLVSSTTNTNESIEEDGYNDLSNTNLSSWSTSDYVIGEKLKASFYFFCETHEYRDPQTHGWRIKFRRIFLLLGVIFFTYQAVSTTITTTNYSSKKEIQKLLDYAGTNLTWPDSGSVLDDVFELYNTMEKIKSYIMIGSTFLFWASLVLDFTSHHAKTLAAKTILFSCSRITGFFGSLTVFASVIVVGLPDYLETSNLDEICPYCGYDFNRTVRQLAEFSIGLFFACLFTFQLIPILITIGPALVRASVLILIHPTLQVEAQRKDEIGEVANLRMSILQQVILFSSLLTFPITFISMAIVQQYQKDYYVTLLILTFWFFPPFILYLGLYLAKKYHRHIILLYVYYMYNMFYAGLLISIIFYSLTIEKVLLALENLVQEPAFWAGSFSQVFLCNVVISDMLYMSVF